MTLGKLILIPSWLHEENSAAQFPLDALNQVYALRLFIAERAKTARRFLKAIDYPHPLSEVQMMELNKHQEDDVHRLLAPCLNGQEVGLISEAGVPAVADPGGIIVDTAHRMGIQVVPLIGPSSLLLALMASGMNGQRFTFHGYLSRSEHDLQKELRAMEQDSRQLNTTHFFIETPYRNDKLMATMLRSLAPTTELSAAVNLTSPSQWIRKMTVLEWKKSGVQIGKQPAVFLLFAGKIPS
jgi:16S rRNA (cytidine1402-2'-O)-methyltransferase